MARRAREEQERQEERRNKRAERSFIAGGTRAGSTSQRSSSASSLAGLGLPRETVQVETAPKHIKYQVQDAAKGSGETAKY